ncbi:MAG: NAD-dependent epimerase/dehydratase family protein, partial [Proteobacteria bacterium]|nr:NAD-dependent epimerase/dehydratase family protein [Pseudomonadota bacterium]
MQKRALITGVTGQDGSYLADFLIDLGYEVHGLVRRTSSSHLGQLLAEDATALKSDKFHLLNGDLTDQSSLEAAVERVKPHEVYNLGAQSFVGESWNQPLSTSDITGLGPLRLLEALRRMAPYARF